jgi:hypothetical protein
VINFFQKKSAPPVNVLPANVGFPSKIESGDTLLKTMRTFRNTFQNDEEPEEVASSFIAAISPDGEAFESYDDIPLNQIPGVLMVRDRTIFADGWMIRIGPYRSFLNYVEMIVSKWWSSPDEETKRQMSAFMHALEVEISKYAHPGHEAWPTG